MKVLTWIGAIVLTVMALAYAIAFSKLGNDLVKPILERKIQETLKLDAKLSGFTLSVNDFEIILELSQSNVITMKGNYSLFSQAFNLAIASTCGLCKSLNP